MLKTFQYTAVKRKKSPVNFIFPASPAVSFKKRKTQSPQNPCFIKYKVYFCSIYIILVSLATRYNMEVGPEAKMEAGLF